MNYKHVVVGGTFDHLHKGHINFLTKAFEISQMVTIGLASSNLFQNKILPESIQSYSQRRKALFEFLSKNNYSKRANIVKIFDIYGPTTTKKDLDALLIPQQHRDNAIKINNSRLEKGFKKLDIIEIPISVGKNSKAISSTEIRLGQINRDGEPYISFFENIQELELPNNLREDLKKPLGFAIRKPNGFEMLKKAPFIVSVGDITTAKLAQFSIRSDISIFDHYSNRHKIIDKNILKNLPYTQLVLTNKAGFINAKTAKRIHDLISQSFAKGKTFGIKIIGEEDLLALPVVLFAPLDSIVLYGLRGSGMIGIKVTEKIKTDLANKYIKKFKVSY